MLHEKKVDVVQKSVSCWQKQDDNALKRFFVRKIVIIFFQNGAPYLKISDVFYH